MRLGAGEHDLAHDELVIAATDRIGHSHHRLQHAVRFVTGRLLRARSIEAPDRRFLAARDDLRLRAKLLRGLRAVDPDVLSAIDTHGGHLLLGYQLSRNGRTGVSIATGPGGLRNGA